MSKVKSDQDLKLELEALAKRSDDEIDTSEIPEITDWSNAERGRFYRPIKQAISLRVDADVLAWFRSLDGKYQSRINQALREYMDAHQRKSDKTETEV